MKIFDIEINRNASLHIMPLYPHNASLHTDCSCGMPKEYRTQIVKDGMSFRDDMCAAETSLFVEGWLRCE